MTKASATRSKANSGAKAGHRGSARKSAGRTAKRASARPRAKKAGTKQETLVAMLRSPKGASVEEVVKALKWQPHTVRGAMAGALKKRLGLTIISEKDEARGRVYRIAT